MWAASTSRSHWLFRIAAAVPALACLPIGCTSESPPSSPPAKTTSEAPPPDFKSAFRTNFRFDAGEQAVVVDLKIEPGYHAYTIGESTGRPLKVEMASDSAFALKGDVKYPEGLKKDLPIGPSVIVEGRAKIVAPVEKRSDATDGAAKGTLRYQVCTDEACDRPRKLSFNVKVLPPPGP